MEIKIGERAQALVRREHSRWLENADNPLTFEAEFEEVLSRLLDMPTLGVPYPTERRPHM